MSCSRVWLQDPWQASQPLANLEIMSAVSSAAKTVGMLEIASVVAFFKVWEILCCCDPRQTAGSGQVIVPLVMSAT